jgi:uncharacterized protein (TIGR03067 family)
VTPAPGDWRRRLSNTAATDLERGFAMTRLPLIAAVAAGLLWFAAARADDAKDVQGTWEPTSAVLNGQKFPDDMLKTIRLVLTDGKYALKLGEQTDAGTIKLDPTKKPKEMDITGTEGPNKDKTFPCIYELKGDTLTVCYSLDGKDRPKEFKAETGSGQFLATYKRAKP